MEAGVAHKLAICGSIHSANIYRAPTLCQEEPGMHKPQGKVFALVEHI